MPDGSLPCSSFHRAGARAACAFPGRGASYSQQSHQQSQRSFVLQAVGIGPSVREIAATGMRFGCRLTGRD